eukprot:CAMPEP_0118930720 /NCGR_PEP_ID=MMETSP1169-20130426/7312_1 /TAXON_ID=36882 /ORGANISM="Pyramimonas obovata, Strain CCMP722" /LENGTH=539 /DNA_ID=CAMNT_0006873119 /DNA_START=169 /DNA_END=1788 /DNA_ORIENTATION=+
MTIRPRTTGISEKHGNRRMSDRERRESKTRFPPLAVEPFYEPPSTAPASNTGEGPLATLQFPGVQEMQALREENENLKRELLDKMRGHNKFISGGHFRGSTKAQECKQCPVSARTIAEASRRIQMEMKQKQQAQNLYEEEHMRSQRLQRALEEAQAKIVELEGNQVEDEDKVPDTPDEVKSLRRKSVLLAEQSAVLEKELEEEKLQAARQAADLEALHATTLQEAQDAKKAHEDLLKEHQAMSAANLEQQALLERMRSEQDELRAQLQSKSEELDALRNGQESEGKLLADLREQLRQAHAQVDAVTAERDQLQGERDHIQGEAKHLEGERGRLVQECARLDNELAAAARQASEVPLLEGEVERVKARLAERDNEFEKERAAYHQSEERVKDADAVAEKLREEVSLLTVERAAINAQLQSMVQLVVVAPSVNVGLGNEAVGQVCAPELAQVEAEVARVLDTEVLPNFLKVFAKNLGGTKDDKDKPPAVPPGYVDQLVADMQTTIGEHLRPVLLSAWNKNNTRGATAAGGRRTSFKDPKAQ